MPRPSVGSAPNPKSDPNAKDKFKDLDSDFKDAVAQSSPEEIYRRITDLTNQNEKLNEAKELDNDLQSAKDRYQTALDPYKEQSKDIKLRIRYCIRVLGDKGKL